MKPLILILALASVAWAGPYKVDCHEYRDIPHKYYIETIRGGCFVGSVQVSDDPKDKEIAEDLAFLMNEAREKRTRPKESHKTTYGEFISDGGLAVTGPHMVPTVITEDMLPLNKQEINADNHCFGVESGKRTMVPCQAE